MSHKPKRHTPLYTPIDPDLASPEDVQRFVERLRREHRHYYTDPEMQYYRLPWSLEELKGSVWCCPFSGLIGIARYRWFHYMPPHLEMVHPYTGDMMMGLSIADLHAAGARAARGATVHVIADAVRVDHLPPAAQVPWRVLGVRRQYQDLLEAQAKLMQCAGHRWFERWNFVNHRERFLDALCYYEDFCSQHGFPLSADLLALPDEPSLAHRSGKRPRLYSLCSQQRIGPSRARILLYRQHACARVPLMMTNK